MPPSAISGTSSWRPPSRAFSTAEILRHADAGDDARRADRAGADADLDRVGAVVGERLARPSAGRDIAADDLQSADMRFLIARTRSSTPCECPCAVSTTTTSHAGRDERFDALLAVRLRFRPPRRPRRRPRSSLHASGCSVAFRMSLTVISPLQLEAIVDHQHALEPVLMHAASWRARARCLRGR